MDLRTEILVEHSKTQTHKIAGWIGNDVKRFKQLLHLFLIDEYRVVQRAAWIISMVAEEHPGLVQPHIAELVERMQEPGLPGAVKRNVVRIMQFMELPEAVHGPVLNACFDFLADPQEAIAVRCFSMTVLANLSKTYPEIRQELTAILEDQLEMGASAGFRSRAKKVLAAFNK